MDFFLSAALIRYELYAFIFCMGFGLIYSASELFYRFQTFWNILFPKGRKVVESIKSSTPKEKSTEVFLPTAAIESPNSIPAVIPPVLVEIDPGLTLEKRLELSDLAKLVRTKIARGEISEARAKIIE